MERTCGAALPATSPLFAETRALLDERVARFREGATSKEMRALSDRLERLGDEAEKAHPGPRTSRSSFSPWPSGSRAIVAAERAALDELEAAING